MSVAGRFLRLGTASMASEGGVFINVERLNFARYAKRCVFDCVVFRHFACVFTLMCPYVILISTSPALAKALMDFIVYHDHNPKKGLELAAEATKACDYKDWWWKARLGKCYYQLGMYREAERQFQSAQRQQVCSFYYRMDFG